MQIVKHRSVHANRFERWLGLDKVEHISQAMRGNPGTGVPRWYGPPIHVLDAPGVRAGADGDFSGPFDRGLFAGALDAIADHVKRYRLRVNLSTLNAGFPSVDVALERATQGFSQSLNGTIQKVGPTGVVGVTSSLWRVGNAPAAGAAGSAAPSGRAPTSATTGAMIYQNPASGTLHLTGADMGASIINNTLLLYDRIFDVAKTMNSTATESVTGVPTRYQSTSVSAADYAGGNFLFIEVGGTALAATAHNWTTCLYRNQAGTDNVTLPSVTGNSGAIVDRLDLPTNWWFAPLASGDTGIVDLAQMQCSAAVATGAVNFVIGHPIGWMSFLIAQIQLPFDWLTNRSLGPRIFNDACLALLEVNKPATTATTYTGQIYATSAAP